MTEVISNIELQEIERKIEMRRKSLYSLIDDNYDFTDKTMVLESQKLDKLLNIYEKLKKTVH
ncbi:putative Spo0E-like regulatory phosphatase [Gottschalkia acidurici 9a]|uniref:Spo0E-like regulatory phosphatase n=2 Tax=Clostridium acidurici TaxID=1556 RepID=K0AUB3_GOTA9|nr:putative Spo0E-like regulatory phosphatase [Gottschalkia acidurici 9a]